MAVGENVIIRVETDKLISVSGDVEQKIKQLEQAFSNMEQKINASKGFWEGDGASAFMAQYRSKRDAIDTALSRFRENVTDLRQIAGVYAQVEKSTLEMANVLPGDCIV